MIVHFIMAVFLSRSQTSLVDLSLAGGKRSLLGHDCLLQGLQRGLKLLDFDDCLGLLLLQFAFSLLDLADSLVECIIGDFTACLQVAGNLRQDTIDNSPTILFEVIIGNNWQLKVESCYKALALIKFMKTNDCNILLPPQLL